MMIKEEDDMSRKAMNAAVFFLALLLTTVPAWSATSGHIGPAHPVKSISADLDSAAVDVFNVAGQKVDTLAEGFMAAGSHSVVWDASGFSAGVYFYTVKSGAVSRTMKMTLVK